MDKPKVPRIQQIHPKVQNVKVDETMPEEKTLSVADRTRQFRFNELSPLMTSMVEDELKNMMIKIWQTLPDDAPNDVEKFVLDKIKNEAINDLRNTMGLNVTKRLLNVSNDSSHKGLLIKIQMHGSESFRDVDEFCKNYQISNLKKIQLRMYAGRIPSWTDLDELYSVKNLTCGKSKVTITPIYNFLKCPPMLKTIFDGQQDYASKEIEKEAAKKINKLEGATIKTADNVLAVDAKKAEVKKEIISKDKATDKKSGDKTEPKKTNNKESSKNVAPKAEDKKPSATKRSQTTNVQNETLKQNSTKTGPKVTNTKPTEAAKKEVEKGEENKLASKTVAKAIPKSATKEPAKTVAKAIPKTATKEPAKTVAKTIPKTATKEPAKIVAKEPPKTVAEKPAKTAKSEPAKPVANESTKPINKEPKPVASKPAPAKKETVTPKPSEKKAVDAKAKNNADDFEELDDHDILALLSSGIVLDTCSGSDVD